MDENGIEDLLKRVQRVEEPPFLFTRIEARLIHEVPVPRTRFMLVACAIAVLLVANVTVIMRSHASSATAATAEMMDAMGMDASNQFYP
ncbi:MAG: hypothetical protein IPO90_06425 [Flavobacteriales bacterium]|nr:hypothetical protein [Flavobacteriales bacterium]